MDRLEEIRKRAENHQAGKVRPFSGRYMLDKDLPWLLERVSELEADVKKWRERAQADHLENNQVKEKWVEQQLRIEELEAENGRIRDKVKAEHEHLKTKLGAARLHESEDADYLSGTEKALEWVLDQVLGTEC